MRIFIILTKDKSRDDNSCLAEYGIKRSRELVKDYLTKRWKKLGAGFITGSSDDDPSGIATYTQAGAKFGLLTLWTALITYPMMYVIQEMCARIGIVTGMGLTGVIKQYYSKYFLYLVILVVFPAITFNIAADISGMSAVANLLIPRVPTFAFSLLFTLFLLYSIFYFSYKKMAIFLKWLCITLLVYVIVPFLVREDWGDVLYATFVPSFQWDKEFATILVAILGTTISPYLFFWQAHMSIEEKNHKPTKSDKKIVKESKADVNFGMFYSNFVMYFIILTAGTVLYAGGVREVETVKDAAEALKPLAGSLAYHLFALGVIGTGLLAIPVLAGSLGYMFAELLNWKSGLDKNPKEAPGFYGIIFFSIIIALFLNGFGLDPIKSLIYTAVLYGIISPFLIAFILVIANSTKIMGQFTNRKLHNTVGVIALILMAGAAIFLLL